MKALRDKFILIPLIISLGLLLISAGWAYYHFRDFNSLLIIHYDGFRGPDFFGTKGNAFQIIGIGFVIMLINGFLADELYWRERLLGYAISFGTTLIALLIFIATAVIISVN